MKRYYFILICILVGSFFLRFYHVSQNPPSLYWDEASLGYNAYSIATTGLDEHGEQYPLSRFIAFGDYKPPGYIYVTAFFIKVFGLSETTIRLPSVLSGVLLTFLTYLVSGLIFQKKKVGLIAAFIIAISPWSIQLSRTAFEANLAALFNISGIYFFLLAVQKKSIYFFLAILFFVCAFYTFNANRIISPFLIIVLTVIYIRTIWVSRKTYILALLFGIMLLSPTIPYFLSRESTLRFQEVSIFTDLSVIQESNERIAREGNAWWSKLIHNRRVLYGFSFLSHFSDHFNPRYLFFTGDRNPRLSVQEMGELYLYEGPFLVLGTYFLLKKKKESLLLISWAAAAIIPAAVARETPHALRTASLIPVSQVLIAYGIYKFFRSVSMYRIRIIFSILLCLITVFSFYYYLHYYFIHYPKEWAGEWQYGYKQMVEEVTRIQDNYDAIVVTDQQGRPYIYFLLYQQISPGNYIRQRRAEREWSGLWNVYGFGKYYFGSKFLDSVYGKVLYVGGPNEIRLKSNIVSTISDPSGKSVFILTEF